jgi:hypothetical protein
VGYSEGAGVPAAEHPRERRESGIRGGGRDRSRLIDPGRDVSCQILGHRLVGYRIVEVWVYLLEVTETLPDWLEKDERAPRWVTRNAAARSFGDLFSLISAIG